MLFNKKSQLSPNGKVKVVASLGKRVSVAGMTTRLIKLRPYKDNITKYWIYGFDALVFIMHNYDTNSSTRSHQYQFSPNNKRGFFVYIYYRSCNKDCGHELLFILDVFNDEPIGFCDSFMWSCCQYKLFMGRYAEQASSSIFEH